MVVHTAPAPANPITDVTFTGFSFAPREKFYTAFQSGILGKLSVRAHAPYLFVFPSTQRYADLPQLVLLDACMHAVCASKRRCFLASALQA